MSNTIDPAFERFMKLRSEIRSALVVGQNESDTRLKVLDRILFEVVYTGPNPDSIHN